MKIKLLFISDKLMDQSFRDNLRLNLVFVSFAITDGRMYTYARSKQRTFVVKGLRKHSNSVVYGAIYALHDDEFHIRTLDSYYLCSLSALHRNHTLDVTHRVVQRVIPIKFDTLDELDRLLYRELEPIEVEMYVGNQAHPTILKRIQQKKHINYRILNGVDKALLTQHREVQNERTKSK